MDYSSYIKEAFDIAKDHGFHDVEFSVNHFIMLIVTEISEMVEADRKNKRCQLNNFDKAVVSLNMDSGFVTKFENQVKDTLEDEMADAARHDKQVKYFMRTKLLVLCIKYRKFQCIDHSACRIDQPACKQP